MDKNTNEQIFLKKQFAFTKKISFLEIYLHWNERDGIHFH